MTVHCRRPFRRRVREHDGAVESLVLRVARLAMTCGDDVSGLIVRVVDRGLVLGCVSHCFLSCLLCGAGGSRPALAVLLPSG